MNTLSLFNGMSVGRMALESLGFTGTYYSSEVDKYAIKASEALYPDSVQLGDVTKWREWDIDWSSIDLVTGGFPCQAWSMAGKQLGDKDERGMLFWVMLDIMKHVKYHNPKAHFMIENVKMKKEFEQYITTHTENALGHVHKILINSALVSAQNRNRYYWTSFEVEQPEDKGILLRDIIEHDGEYTYMSEKFISRQKGRKCLRDDLDGKAVNLSAMEYAKNGRQGDYIKCLSEKEMAYMMRSESKTEHRPRILRAKGLNEKSNTLTQSMYEGVPHGVIKCGSMIGRKINPETGKRDDYNPDIKTQQRIEVRSDEKTGTLTTVQKDNLVISKSSYRKLTPRECMRLQTIPERHIDTLLNAGISNTQLYKMTGNAWTMEVIKHILKGVTKC
jgi:DNA-cytosine methyltransferase